VPCALEVCSRQDAMQIHVYLYLILYGDKQKRLSYLPRYNSTIMFSFLARFYAALLGKTWFRRSSVHGANFWPFSKNAGLCHRSKRMWPNDNTTDRATDNTHSSTPIWQAYIITANQSSASREPHWLRTLRLLSLAGKCVTNRQSAIHSRFQ